MGPIGLADQWAERQHKGQFRADGVTPYIEHPRAVAQIIIDQVDMVGWTGEEKERIICTALLHDVVEDTPTTIEQIRGHFGEEIAFCVDGVTEDVWKYKGSDKKYPRDERQYAYAMKVIEYAERDSMVLWVKLADMLHNMSDLDGMKYPFRRKFALEKLNFLGLWHRHRRETDFWTYEKMAMKIEKLALDIVKDLRGKPPV